MTPAAEEVPNSCAVPQNDRLVEPELIKVASMVLEPCRQAPIVIRLRHRRRRGDTEDFSAHIRTLKCPVEVRPDHAGATHAVQTAIAQPRKRRERFASIERRDAEVDLISAESHASGR